MLRSEVVRWCLLTPWAGWGLRATAAPPKLSSLSLVDVSGRQRMHSQRLLKAYAQWALEVMPERARIVLSESLSGLNQGHAALREAPSDATVIGLLAVQSNLIDRLAGATVISPSPSAVQRVAELCEELLGNAETLTALYALRPPQPPAAVVNLVARQRMLSQRAAAGFLLYQTALRAPELKQRALSALAEFKRTLAALEDARAEFIQISGRIEVAKVQMVFFENALSRIDQPEPEQLSSVVVLSERILTEMDALTADLTRLLNARHAGTPSLR